MKICDFVRFWKLPVVSLGSPRTGSFKTAFSAYKKKNYFSLFFVCRHNIRNVTLGGDTLKIVQLSFNGLGVKWVYHVDTFWFIQCGLHNGTKCFNLVYVFWVQDIFTVNGVWLSSRGIGTDSAEKITRVPQCTSLGASLIEGYGASSYLSADNTYDYFLSKACKELKWSWIKMIVRCKME